jgi:peptide chain release factor 2
VITFDPESLKKRLAELEEELGKPGFWDDQQRAAQISAEHARTARKVERYERLVREYEDARELLAMDGDMAGEIAESLAPLRSELDRLQEDALFTGRYDAGGAVVTIHAGTGGTDAQDWAEILLRMYLRWTADRGFQTELIEASPGEEAGLKSATFTVRGEKDDVEIDIDEADLRIDTYRASGAGGQHVNKTDSAVRITHLPTAIVVQCQNERSQASNKHTAMKMLKSRLAELAEEEREAELARERGAAQDISFGSQIRSYVLHPYQLVKDHRTDFEMGNAQGVLDGDLDGFIHSYLLAKASGKAV